MKHDNVENLRLKSLQTKADLRVHQWHTEKEAMSDFTYLLKTGLQLPVGAEILNNWQVKLMAALVTPGQGNCHWRATVKQLVKELIKTEAFLSREPSCMEKLLQTFINVELASENLPAVRYKELSAEAIDEFDAEVAAAEMEDADEKEEECKLEKKDKKKKKKERKRARNEEGADKTREEKLRPAATAVPEQSKASSDV